MSESLEEYRKDPVEFGDGIGVGCVPIPGLYSDARELQISDLRVREIDVLSWLLLDNNRATDLYTSHYQQLPRYYLVRSLYEDDDDKSFIEMNRAIQDTGDLVFALQLLSDEDVIAPDNVVAHRRLRYMNLRPLPNVGQSRFLVTTFGEPRTFPVLDKFTGREWEEELLSLGGTPYFLPEKGVPFVEERLALIRANYEVPPSQLLGSAIRNFSVGRSRLTGQHQRLLALFCALETLLGGFRRPRTRPSLGDLVANLVTMQSEEKQEKAQTFEQHLRPVRNSLAHGNNSFSTEYLEAAWTGLSQIVRAALTLAMTLAVCDAIQRERLAALPYSPSPEPSGEHLLPCLRNLITQAYRGNTDALELIVEMWNR